MRLSRRHGWLLVAAVICSPLLAVAFGGAPDLNSSGATPVTFGSAVNKTVVMKTGTLASSATTADQVVLTYTVTAGKIFYLEYFEIAGRLTTYAATATNFGDCSIENPSGTKLYTQMVTSVGQSLPLTTTLAEPIPAAAGSVVRVVCTPSATTAFTWRANFGGYER